MKAIRLTALLAALLLALTACGSGSTVGAGIDAENLGEGDAGALGTLEDQLAQAEGDAEAGALGEDERQAQEEAAAEAEKRQEEAAKKQEEQIEKAREQSKVTAKITAKGIEPTIIKVTTGGVVEVCNEDGTQEDPDHDQIPGRQVETEDERYAWTDSDGVTYGFISGSLPQGSCWQWNVVDPRPQRQGQPAVPGRFRYFDTERPFYFGEICVLPPDGSDAHCG